MIISRWDGNIQMELSRKLTVYVRCGIYSFLVCQRRHLWSLSGRGKGSGDVPTVCKKFYHNQCKEFVMEQSLWRKERKILVVAMLCAAICLGMVWLASSTLMVRADEGTLLMGTSYKDATPREVSPGGTVNYTIVLHNNSQISPTGQVTVTDVLDERLSKSGVTQILPEGVGYSLPPQGNTLRFVVFSMEPGARVTVTFQAVVTTTVQPGEVITNTAVVSDGSGDLLLPVTVTVAALPTTEIDSPWNLQHFTQRGMVVIRGRVWAGSMPAGFPQAPHLLSISNGGGAFNQYVVQWESVANAQLYTLQESTDASFAVISDEQTTTNLSIPYTNKTRNRTYYYRVKTFTGNYESRWSNMQAVVVNAAQVAGALVPGAPAAQAVQAPNAAPLVDLVITRVGGPTINTYAATVVPDPLGGDWWNWTYTWTLPIENEVTQYTLQSIGKDIIGNYDPAKTDTITVTIRNGIRYVYLPLLVKRYPPVPYAATLSLASNDTFGTYQLSWNYNHSQFAPTKYRLQEATDANFANLIVNAELAPGVTTQAYANKTAGTYYYRVRGINAYGEGEWSNVISVVANPQVPFAPVLAVASNNGYGTYQLSWTYPDTRFLPTHYRIQESTNVNFTSPSDLVLAQGVTTASYSGKAVGTYYYRVRGINAIGEGVWSNVITISVTASGYFDDFDNSASGWFRGTLQESGRNVVSGLYMSDATYRVKVMLNTSGLNNYRMGIMPAPYVHTDSSYDVEVDQSFKKADDQTVEPTGGKAGLVFRADYNTAGYFPTIYVVEWNYDGSCAVYKYSKIGGKLTDLRGNVITWEPLYSWSGGCVAAGYDKNLHVKVEVRGSNATVYLGTKNLGTFSGIGGANRMGVLTGSWERTPVESAFDNFKVTEK